MKDALGTFGTDSLGAVEQQLMSLATNRALLEQLSLLNNTVAQMQGTLTTLQRGQEEMKGELRQARPAVEEGFSSDLEEAARKRPRIGDPVPDLWPMIFLLLSVCSKLSFPLSKCWSSGCGLRQSEL